MRAVIQRVSKAEVWETDTLLGRIEKGLLILLAIGQDDQESDLDYLLNKVVSLRIFEDEKGKMNQSIEEVGGQLLIIPQFTLYGDCRKGRRPSFDGAAPPKMAEAFYETFSSKAKQRGIQVATGRFQSRMDVHLVNSGPVTILLDSRKIF
jgi:D-tyrosyl-tRNA(Tyr) deacylase